MERTFELVMQRGPSAGRRYLLDQPEITIGREVSNNIPINDAEVSRHHIKLIRQDDGYVVQDLGSTNGTFVNESRLSGLMRLEPGVTLRLGDNVILTYEATGGGGQATITSTPQRPAPAVSPPPVQSPPPRPAQQHAGHVPASPPTAPKEGGRRRIIIIGCGTLLVLGACIAVAALMYVDYFNLWCDWFGFLLSNRCVL